MHVSLGKRVFENQLTHLLWSTTAEQTFEIEAEKREKVEGGNFNPTHTGNRSHVGVRHKNSNPTLDRQLV